MILNEELSQGEDPQLLQIFLLKSADRPRATRVSNFSTEVKNPDLYVNYFYFSIVATNSENAFSLAAFDLYVCLISLEEESQVFPSSVFHKLPSR